MHPHAGSFGYGEGMHGLGMCIMLISLHTEYKKFTCAQGWYSTNLGGKQKGFFIQIFLGSIS
jgi:hypothetical protein